MKKHVFFIGIMPILLASLSSCNLADLSGITEQSVIEQIYSEYKNNGGTLDYSDWLLSIKGEKGDPGEPGQKGEDGADGKDGIDGQTPYVGENGNWWIGDTDTGIAAYVTNQSNTPNLEQFDFYLQNDGTYAIGEGGAKYLDEVVIPDSFNGRPVTAIAPKGFQEAKIKSIIFSNNIKYIGYDAFYKCENLTNIDLKNTVSIGIGAFANCFSLGSVFINRNISFIGAFSFSVLDYATPIELVIENDFNSDCSRWFSQEKITAFSTGGYYNGYDNCSGIAVDIETNFYENTNPNTGDFRYYNWQRKS